MIRWILRCGVAALLLACAACAHHERPGPDLAPVAPRHIDAALCTHPTPRPELPVGAAIQKPQSDELTVATAEFLNWVAQLKDHDKALADRAEKTASSSACI